MTFKNSSFASHSLAIADGSPGYPFVPFVKVDRTQLTLRMLMEQPVAAGSDITLGIPETCARRSEVDAVFRRHAVPGAVELPQLGRNRLIAGRFLDPDWDGLGFTELGAVSLAIDAGNRPQAWIPGSIWIFPVDAKGPSMGRPQLPFARHVDFPQADLRAPKARWTAAEWAQLRADRNCHVVLKVSPPAADSSFDECRYQLTVMTPTGSRATMLGDLKGRTRTLRSYGAAANPFARMPTLNT